MDLREKALTAIELLKEAYPLPSCALESGSAYEFLIAVRLSAQCTDKRVNLVTPALFARFPTLEAFAGAEPEDVEPYIHSCGLAPSKARDIVGACRMLLTQYGGTVPDTVEELLKLPGVGRKTANLVCGDIYGKPAVVTDTHLIRIANRLGLVHTVDPYKVEKALRELLPPEESNDFCHRCVLHGRAVCAARSPRCGACALRDCCDWRAQ